MELVKDIAIAIFSLAFLSGFLTTVFTGSGRNLKILLVVLTILFLVISVAGFFVTSGWLIFLYTQLIVLWLIIYGVIVTGAVFGGGIFLFLHKRQVGETVGGDDLGEFIPVTEFAILEQLDEDRVLGRIRSRYYRGGRFNGAWYVHQSELTNKPPG
jgi:hypothetical protein